MFILIIYFKHHIKHDCIRESLKGPQEKSKFFSFEKPMRNTKFTTPSSLPSAEESAQQKNYEPFRPIKVLMAIIVRNVWAQTIGFHALLVIYFLNDVPPPYRILIFWRIVITLYLYRILPVSCLWLCYQAQISFNKYIYQ